MNKSQLLKKLKNLEIEELIKKCAEIDEIPPSVKKRINEYERVCLMKKFDESFGKHPVAGIDEAGRGPLAGRVYTAAVILPENIVIEGLNDSKKLSAKKRGELFEIIKQTAVDYKIVYAEHDEIDKINIRNATFNAMAEAANSLGVIPAIVLVDGDGTGNIIAEHKCVIGGDGKSMAVAAASVLAKVARDTYMEKMDKIYPEYGFASNKGYGSKVHIEAIKKYGPSPIHRKTFIKNFI